MQHRISWLARRALAAALVATSALGVALASDVSAAAPTSVVLGDTVAVQDGDVIQVSGTAAPGDSIILTQCGNYNVTTSTYRSTAGTCTGFGNPAGSVGAAAPVHNTPIIADAGGNWGPVGITVSRQWTQPSGTVIACRERNLTNPAALCGIRAVNFADQLGTQADFHMAPTLTVTPNTGIVDGQTVSVTVADLPATTTSLTGGFGLCPTHATYNHPNGAANGTLGQPLLLTDTGVSPTAWVPSYCGSPPASGQGIGTAVAADGSATFAFVVETGITNSNYAATSTPPACNPGDTCQVIAFQSPANATRAAVAPITLAAAAAAPELTVDDVVGQAVTTAGRAGDQIDLGGSDFEDGSATVDLCDVDGTSNCAAIGTATVTGGSLDGTVTIPVGATTGLRALRATSGATSDTASFTVLAAPTVSAPASGGVGSTITVSGTEWNPGSTTTALSFLDGASAPIGSPTPLTISGSGGFTQNVTVPAGAASIQVADGALSATTAFSVASDSTVCDGSPLSVSAPNDCTLQQQVIQTVLGGAFTFSQNPGVVTMSSVTLDGTDRSSTGSLQDLSLVDARGSNAGWSLTATLTDFTDGTPSASGNHVIPKANLVVDPDCTAVNGGSVSAGADDQSFAGTVTLCTAAPGDSGGEFTADGDLALTIPAQSYAGTYTATMTLLVV